MLLTEHNLTFLAGMVAGAREAILAGSYGAYLREWSASW